MNFDYTLIAVFLNEQKNLLGNIAAVVRTDKQIDEPVMQRIALQLNQPATSFISGKQDNPQIRWYAPDSEIMLCGHGAMAASAYWNEKYNKTVPFHYKNGITAAEITEGKLSVVLPKGSYEADVPPSGLANALGSKIKAYYKTSDKDIVVLSSESELRNMDPDFYSLKSMKPFGYAVTAKGDHTDFVSRTLVPKVQQLEDHATGSSHTVLAPFWSQVLNKSDLESEQLSPRGGAFRCVVKDNTVQLVGDYKVVAQGQLIL